MRLKPIHFLFAAAVLAAFLGGVELCFRRPELCAPAMRSFDLGRGILVLTLQRIFDLSPSENERSRLNANTFEVRASQPGLKGSVLFAMRAPSDQWEWFDSRLVEVSRSGEVQWEYRVKRHDPGLYISSDVRRLPNGNTLFPVNRKYGRKMFAYFNDAYRPPGYLQRFTFSAVLEVNPRGEVVRTVNVPVSHHAEVLPNGNLLTVSSHQDLVLETAPDGTEVWRWDAADHIQPYTPQTYAGFQPGFVSNTYTWRPDATDWTHMNSAQRLENGNTLISLRNQDLVIEVNPAGETVWSFGPLVLKHQHCAWILENGNLLVTDNGNARVIEVERGTQKIIWEYSRGLNMLIEGCAYRLPNGNTLITDSGNYRVLEVTPDGETAWELAVLTPVEVLYRAWWVAP